MPIAQKARPNHQTACDGLRIVLTGILLFATAGATSFDLANPTSFSLEIHNGGNPLVYGWVNASVQIVNADNGAYPNDALVNSNSTPAKVFLIRNIDQKSGSLDLTNPANADTTWVSDASLYLPGNPGAAYPPSGGPWGGPLVNLDNGAFANDLILIASRANANGRNLSGSVYIVRNIDTQSGVQDLANPASYSVRFDGPSSFSGLCEAVQCGVPMIWNLDNGAYPNDLLMLAPVESAGGFSFNGALYLVRNVDALSGIKDLANPANFSAKWTGSKTNERFSMNTYGNIAKASVARLNADNGAYPNDLLVNSSGGRVYLLTNVDSASGTRALNNPANFSIAWTGNASGSALIDWPAGPVLLDTPLVNADNGAFADDLFLQSESFCLIRNLPSYVSTHSGVVDLSNAANASVCFSDGFGAGLSEQAPGVNMIVNADNGAYANDLILPSIFAQVSGRTDAGTVYVIRNIDSLSGFQDLSNPANFFTRFDGSASNEYLYLSPGSLGNQLLVNVDNGPFANDLLLHSLNGEGNFDGKIQNGAVYLIRNIDTRTGVQDLANAANYSARFTGASDNDQLGWFENTGAGQAFLGAWPPIQLINADNGALANDLVLSAPVASTDGKTQNGAIYFIRNIDSVNGNRDLSNASNYTARWSGGASNDQIGYADYSGSAVQIINLDNQATANDLLVSGSYVDALGRSDNGAAYLIRNLGSWTGTFDLSAPNSSTHQWVGAANESDLTNASNDQGMRLLNINNGPFANDLLFATFGSASVRGRLHLIKDLHFTSLIVTNVVNGGTAQATDFQFFANGIPIATGTATTLAPNSYTITQTGPADYTTTYGGNCNSSGVVNLLINDAKTCTATHTFSAAGTGQLRIVKTVINNNGGTKTPANWTYFIDASPVPHDTFVSVPAGAHNVSESADASYQPSTWGTDCAANGSVNVVAGQSYTCTITNDDNPLSGSTPPTGTIEISSVALVQPSGITRLSQGAPVIKAVGNPIDRVDVELLRTPNATCTNPELRFKIVESETAAIRLPTTGAHYSFLPTSIPNGPSENQMNSASISPANDLSPNSINLSGGNHYLVVEIYCNNEPQPTDSVRAFFTVAAENASVAAPEIPPVLLIFAGLASAGILIWRTNRAQQKTN